MALFEIPKSEPFDSLATRVEELKKSDNNAKTVIDTRIAEESTKILTYCKEIGIKAFERIRETREKLTGLTKYDNVIVVDNGGAHSEQGSWTKARYIQLEKTSAALKELTTAFDKAMSSSNYADFQALEKVLQKTENTQKQ